MAGGEPVGRPFRPLEVRRQPGRAGGRPDGSSNWITSGEARADGTGCARRRRVMVGTARSSLTTRTHGGRRQAGRQAAVRVCVARTHPPSSERRRRLGADAHRCGDDAEPMRSQTARIADVVVIARARTAGGSRDCSASLRRTFPPLASRVVRARRRVRRKNRVDRVVAT